MSIDTITKTVFFKASRETVWSFLTEKDKLALWFHPAENDLVEGEPYALIRQGDDGSTTKICWGNVLEMDRPSRLVYSFTVKPLGAELTTVTWTLVDAHGGTKLSMKHEGITGATREAALSLSMSFDAGWDKHFASLREALNQS